MSFQHASEHEICPKFTLRDHLTCAYLFDSQMKFWIQKIWSKRICPKNLYEITVRVGLNLTRKINIILLVWEWSTTLTLSVSHRTSTFACFLSKITHFTSYNVNIMYFWYVFCCLGFLWHFYHSSGMFVNHFKYKISNKLRLDFSTRDMFYNDLEHSLDTTRHSLGNPALKHKKTTVIVYCIWSIPPSLVWGRVQSFELECVTSSLAAMGAL